MGAGSGVGVGMLRGRGGGSWVLGFVFVFVFVVSVFFLFLSFLVSLFVVFRSSFCCVGFFVSWLLCFIAKFQSFKKYLMVLENNDPYYQIVISCCLKDIDPIYTISNTF